MKTKCKTQNKHKIWCLIVTATLRTMNDTIDKKGSVRATEKSVYRNRRFYLIIVCAYLHGKYMQTKQFSMRYFFSLPQLARIRTKLNNITTDDIIIRWSEPHLRRMLLLCRAIFYLFSILASTRNHRRNRHSVMWWDMLRWPNKL